MIKNVWFGYSHHLPYQKFRRFVACQKWYLCHVSSRMILGKFHILPPIWPWRLGVMSVKLVANKNNQRWPLPRLCKYFSSNCFMHSKRIKPFSIFEGFFYFSTHPVGCNGNVAIDFCPAASMVFKAWQHLNCCELPGGLSLNGYELPGKSGTRIWIWLQKLLVFFGKPYPAERFWKGIVSKCWLQG